VGHRQDTDRQDDEDDSESEDTDRQDDEDDSESEDDEDAAKETTDDDDDDGSSDLEDPFATPPHTTGFPKLAQMDVLKSTDRRYRHQYFLKKELKNRYAKHTDTLKKALKKALAEEAKLEREVHHMRASAQRAAAAAAVQPSAAAVHYAALAADQPKKAHNEWVGQMLARSVALGQLPRQGDRPVREEEYADPEEYRPE
jgi:hypothetical protein